MSVPTRQDWRKWLGPIASVVVLAIALTVLARLTHSLRLRDVLAQLHAIPWSMLLVSGALTVGSYSVLTLYEMLAVRTAGRSLGYLMPALTSFVAYAVGHNVGFSALSGGAVRYRSYSLAGLSASEIAQIIAFSTLTFALGTGTLLGIALIATAARSATLLHVSPSVLFALGTLILTGITAYVTITALRKAPLEVRGWQVKLPSFGTTWLQLGLSVTDLTLVSSALYVLLPDGANISYPAFLAIYLVGMVAGVISTVPGGLGVFESVLLILMPGITARALLGSLLAFRVVYYVLPFLLSLAAMVGHEAWRNRATW